MPESYHKRCRELDICNELIEKFFNKQNKRNVLKVIWLWQSRGIRLRKR